MNQEELAYLVGTARQTVSSWERDVFMPDSANLLKLAEALRTSVAYLMGEVLDPDAPEKRKDCAGEGEGLCVVYSLTARVRDDSVMLSVERRECGKTVRYDIVARRRQKGLPPRRAAMAEDKEGERRAHVGAPWQKTDAFSMI